MIIVETTQEYIDNILFDIQCCIGSKGDTIATRDGLGYRCDKTKRELNLLIGIRDALVSYDITVADEDSCLTAAQINDLIDKTKSLCKDCCIENILET